MLFFVTTLLYSQEKNEYVLPVLKIKDGNIGNIVWEYYSKTPEKSKIDSSCYMGCSFVRFKVDTLGKIADILFSRNTPDNLIPFISKAISSTNGEWEPAYSNNKKITSNFFLLPIFFILENNCTPKDGSYASLLSILTTNNTPIPNYPSFSGIYPESALECILLNPILLKSPTHTVK